MPFLVSDPYSRGTFGSVKSPRESSHIACRPEGYGVPVLTPWLFAERSEEDHGAVEVIYGHLKGHPSDDMVKSDALRRRVAFRAR